MRQYIRWRMLHNKFQKKPRSELVFADIDSSLLKWCLYCIDSSLRTAYLNQCKSLVWLMHTYQEQRSSIGFIFLFSSFNVLKSFSKCIDGAFLCLEGYVNVYFSKAM
jgi:hypothetical protein